MSRTGNSTEKVNQWLPAAVEFGEKCGVAVNKFGISSWGDENVWKLMMMMFAQLYEYAKNNQTVCFKWILGI